MIDLYRATRVTDPSVLKDIPGPGYYSPPPAHKVSSYLFERSERAVSDLTSHGYEDTPGPGSYDTSTKSSLVTHRSAFNASSPRFTSVECSWKPGPGAYYLSHSPEKPLQKVVQTLCIHPSPVPASIPLLERHDLAVFDGLETKVGPGEYYPKFEQVKPRYPASLFSKSKLPRMHERQLSSLGPGSYFSEPQRQPMDSWPLAKAQRFNEIKSISPGPAAYNPSLSPTKPALAGCYISRLERSPNLIHKITQEHPVNHRKPVERVLPTSVFLSTTERDCNKPLSESPVGPGKYELPEYKPATFAFNSERRFRENTEPSAGPGSYEVQELGRKKAFAEIKAERFSELSEVYVHSLGQRRVPGPGTYELQTMPRNYKGVTFEQTTPRLELKRELSPDPGQYYSEPSGSPGKTIGAERRFRSGLSHYIQPKGSGDAVGPGSYKQKSSMVKRTHNISWL